MCKRWVAQVVNRNVEIVGKANRKAEIILKKGAMTAEKEWSSGAKSGERGLKGSKVANSKERISKTGLKPGNELGNQARQPCQSLLKSKLEPNWKNL
jgi:hypothetical protein